MSSVAPNRDRAIILVVEDEPFLRILAAPLVEEAGFEPLEAPNSDEAIRILESRDDIRVIFTDVDMPKGSINGLKLTFAIRDRWAPIEIIIVSGHHRASEDEMPGGSVFYTESYRHTAVIKQMQTFVGH